MEAWERIILMVEVWEKMAEQLLHKLKKIDKNSNNFFLQKFRSSIGMTKLQKLQKQALMTKLLKVWKQECTHAMYSYDVVHVKIAKYRVPYINIYSHILFIIFLQTEIWKE